MPIQKFKNNAASTLNGALSVGGAFINVAVGHGTRFPTPSDGEYFLVTLYERNTQGVEINHEVVKVTAIAGDTLTIERDFEGVVIGEGGSSGGRAFPSDPGTNPSQIVYVELRYTAYAAANTLTRDGNLQGITDPAVARANLQLDQINNTSDANKPVSTAQAAADTAVLNAAKADATTKANAAQEASTPIAHASNTANPHSVTKAQVGLGNVDNTSDLNKPVSTAQAAAFVGKTSATGSAQLPAGTTGERDSSPTEGLIRFNTTTKQFEGYFNGAWQSVGGGQLLGNALTKAVFFNAQTIAENLTIKAGTNGGSFGPMTINDGVTVTVEDGAVWSIV